MSGRGRGRADVQGHHVSDCPEFRENPSGARRNPLRARFRRAAVRPRMRAVTVRQVDNPTLSLLKTPSGEFLMAPLQLATTVSRDCGGGAVREPLNPVGETTRR
jgi:hypothetical protein